MNPLFARVGVIGAGAMGRGIAQIAAQSGSVVHMFDMQAQACATAQSSVFAQWDKLGEKGRMSAEQIAQCKARLRCAESLQALSECALVIEAVVERLDVKAALFAQLEDIVSPSSVLATNTSSLSVTAIAAQLKRPAQLAGYHFFNPVPLMKIVEVIDGLLTAPWVTDALLALGRRMGHTAVRI